MKVQLLQQGTPEWHAYRRQHFNASDAPAMMGCSPYKTRSELLDEYQFGASKQIDATTLALFEEGHRFEALARPLAEHLIGSDLYPVTGSSGKLSASFDGLTMDEGEGFEHKSLNNELRTAFEDIDASTAIDPGYLLPIHYRIQMEQQLLVSGAKRILFMASKWNADGSLIEEHHCWYYPDKVLREQIVAGWEQFEIDMAGERRQQPADKPVGRTPETLPALLIEVKGEVTASNLNAFREHAFAVLAGINRDLNTDQDFADAEKTVKWCGDVETRLDAAKQHALSQTSSIDTLFRTIDDIKAEARRLRLDLDKLVKARKEQIRIDAIQNATSELRLHIDALNAEIAPARLADISSYASSLKDAAHNKRTVKGLYDAINLALANIKIETRSDADHIKKNMAELRAFSLENDRFQFSQVEIAQIVHKSTEDMLNFAKLRVQSFNEQREKAAAETREAAAVEATRALEQDIQTSRVADLSAMANVAQAQDIPMVVALERAEVINLSKINERLAPIQITADGLATLGFKYIDIIKNSKLYRESDFENICVAIAKRAIDATETMKA